ncbi:MAG: protein/domain typically associated with flavoprotein oxygenase, DIM6/NTAB family protein [Acidobacteria bacterium]|nr:MAG: protein/domain typically associated with flavoprotein oxygenase, DIM6/NTAB family protein [Acidobacteriota bacterium]
MVTHHFIYGMENMQIDFNQLSKSQKYYLMTQVILPRPIAWVLSEHANSKLNLAPFSYFNGVSSEPPLLMISVGRKRDGSPKDTWTNILERRHFVVHLASQQDKQALEASAFSYDRGISECQELNLKTSPMANASLPRLTNARVALFCHLYKILEVGEGSQALILGQIESSYVDDSCIEVDNRKMTIDPEKLDPLGRLGGTSYCGIQVSE